MSRPDPKDYFITNRKSESITRIPGSINGLDFAIDTAEDCTIILLDHIEQIQADFIKNSILILGPVNGSIFMRDCSNVTVIVACRQFRARDCHDCHIFLYCATKSPVIESSSNMHFHPYNISFPTLSNAFTSCKLPSTENHWNSIFDFTPADQSAAAAAVAKPHYLIESATPTLIEIAIEKNFAGESIGEPATPLQSLIQWNGIRRETLESLKLMKPADLLKYSTSTPTAATSAAAAPLAVAAVSDSVPLAFPGSPTGLTALADSFLDNSDAFDSATKQVPVASNSSIDNLLAKTSAAAAAVVSSDFSFTFSTSQTEAQQIIDDQEILKSMAEYGEKRQENEKEEISTPAPARTSDSSTSAKPAVANSFDSFWTDIVKRETKSEVEKESIKKEKEKAKMESIRIKLDEETEAAKRKMAEKFTEDDEENKTVNKNQQELVDPTSSEELKRIESERQLAIDNKLQASSISLQSIASEAQQNHMANREIRAHLRAEAEKIIKESEANDSKHPLNPEASWAKVMSLIPNDRMKSQFEQKNLAILKTLYMKSLAGREMKSAPSSSAAAADENASLRVLLDSCGCGDCFDRFVSEGVSLDLIPLLDSTELAELIPKLGPRKRVEIWIKEQQQMQQENESKN